MRSWRCAGCGYAGSRWRRSLRAILVTAGVFLALLVQSPLLVQLPEKIIELDLLIGREDGANAGAALLTNCFTGSVQRGIERLPLRERVVNHRTNLLLLFRTELEPLR